MKIRATTNGKMRGMWDRKAVALAATLCLSAGSLGAGSLGISAAHAQTPEGYDGDVVENTRLGKGWTGNVDLLQGSCAIFKVQGPVHMSLYSDSDDRDGYWLFSGSGGAKFAEGPAEVQIVVNDINISEYDSELSVDGPRYSYKLPYHVLRGAFAASPNGMRLTLIQSGRVVHEIDATGALKAYTAYRKCNANLPGSTRRK